MGVFNTLPSLFGERLHSGSGVLLMTVAPVKNARSYEVRHAKEGELVLAWQTTLFTQSRDMPIRQLEAGTRYVFQVRAIGGKTAVSDWSDPSAHMSL